MWMNALTESEMRRLGSEKLPCERKNSQFQASNVYGKETESAYSAVIVNKSLSHVQMTYHTESLHSLRTYIHGDTCFYHFEELAN